MKRMTLGESDILLVKEALEYSISGEKDIAPEKEKEVRKILDRIKLLTSEAEIRSPLGHIWRPM